MPHRQNASAVEDPIIYLFEQRAALNAKLHDDLTAATNGAEEDAANAAFADALSASRPRSSPRGPRCARDSSTP